MSSHHTSVLVRCYIILLSLVGLTSAICYLPDGSKNTDDDFQPCSNKTSDPLSNICCATNRKNPSGGKASDGVVADVCLSNGLCLQHYVDDNGKHNWHYFRAYCTSPDFRGGTCLDVCEQSGTSFKQLTPCDGSNGSSAWCCGGNTDCCNPFMQSKQNIAPVTLSATFNTVPTIAVSSTTPTPSSIVTTAPTPAASSSAVTTPTSTPKSGLSTGAKAGIGVGAAGGGLVLLGLGALLGIARQRRQGSNTEKSQPQEEGYDDALRYGYVTKKGVALEVSDMTQIGELGHGDISRDEPGELPARGVVVELPGDGVRLERKR